MITIMTHFFQDVYTRKKYYARVAVSNITVSRVTGSALMPILYALKNTEI